MASSLDSSENHDESAASENAAASGAPPLPPVAPPISQQQPATQPPPQSPASPPSSLPGPPPPRIPSGPTPAVPPAAAAPNASAVAPSTVPRPSNQEPVAASANATSTVANASGPKAEITADHTVVAERKEKNERRRRAPSWLASFVLHLAILLVLALVPLRQLASGPVSFFLGASEGEVEESFDLSTSDAQTEALESTDQSPEETPDATEPLKALELPTFDVASEVIEPTQLTAVESLESLPFGLTNGLSGRQGEMKSQLLSAFGGSAETEQAVELGLAWLARNQNSNGSWSLTGPYAHGGVSENKTAATAMALNAFLGAGYTHKEGKYQTNVALGLKFLLKRQDKDGFFADREPSRQQMYAQAIASICVIEAYGLTKDTTLIGPAQSAIDFAEWSQSPLRGWRYDPRDDADTSVTGWYVMLLATGQMAGLDVDKLKFKSVNVFLDSVAHADYTRYAYTKFQGPSLSMTAEGILCRLYLGWTRSHPGLVTAVQQDLLPNLPADNGEESSVYYTYYATQVMHHFGGEPWKTWNDAMKRVLPATQQKVGPERGSWNPQDDIYGAAGGRLYVTCLNLYCLQVYYRHLALYDLK